MPSSQENPQPPHPLEAVRAEAANTTSAQVRAELGDLTAKHTALAAHSGWSAAAEEAFRLVIGMERKSQLEMRVALGEAGSRHVRHTRALAEMTLAELRAEYLQTRHVTLALLDEVLHTPGVTPWTLGEQVAPGLYIVALKNRLARLGDELSKEQLPNG